jgi:hypothetical protein
MDRLECADAFVGPAAAGRAPEGRRALPQAAAFLLVQELATGALVQTPHRAHWQPTDYNALHGGFERWFDPVEPAVARPRRGRTCWPAWAGCLPRCSRPSAGILKRTSSASTPRAGWAGRRRKARTATAWTFVVVMMVARHGVKGGETRVFDANGPHGVRFVMQEPLTALLLDDARVIHETTPILPADDQPVAGFRDTLVLTYRAAGFQAP